MSKLGAGLLVMFLIGLVMFGYFLFTLGDEAVLLIVKNINFFYFSLFVLVAVLGFVFSTLRWQVILKAYRKKISFFTLLRQMIAGYAISYVTPAIKLGGEPLRAYMLKKERGVDLKTGTASIILDKFVEVAGLMFFGLIGLIFFVYIPKIDFSFKIPFIVIILFFFLALFIFYYRTITGKGSFSSMFNIFKLYKIAKLKNLTLAIEDVEEKLRKFFIKNKKEFVLAFIFHSLYILLMVLEMEFLLLSFGSQNSLTTIVLALTVLTVVGFIPVPAGLGFLEAGQAGLFLLLKGNSGIGLALSLMLRIGASIFIVIGFIIILFFGAGQAKKLIKKFV